MMIETGIDMVGMAAASCIAGVCLILTASALVYLVYFRDKTIYRRTTVQYPSRSTSRVSIIRSQIGQSGPESHRWATIGSSVQREPISIMPSAVDIPMGSVQRRYDDRVQNEMTLNVALYALGAFDLLDRYSAPSSGHNRNYQEFEGVVTFDAEGDYDDSIPDDHESTNLKGIRVTKNGDVSNNSREDQVVSVTLNENDTPEHVIIIGGNIGNNSNNQRPSSGEMSPQENQTNNDVDTNGDVNFNQTHQESTAMFYNGNQQSEEDNYNHLHNSADTDVSERRQRDHAAIPPPPPCPPPFLPQPMLY